MAVYHPPAGVVGGRLSGLCLAQHVVSLLHTRIGVSMMEKLIILIPEALNSWLAESCCTA